MNIFNPSIPTRMLSTKKPQYRLPLIPLSILVILLPFLYFYYYTVTPHSLSPVSSKALKSQSIQCSSQVVAPGEKFLWYAPHSGFSNQLSESKNAILMEGILNRTLIVPPILDHHAVALGSCPKLWVVNPRDIQSCHQAHSGWKELTSGRMIGSDKKKRWKLLF